MEEAYLTEMPADPGLNLEFVDEALSLVRDAEAKGIRLRILGSIAYRLQCPRNLHLFEDTKRVLTDVDFGAEKKQNRAIREFLTSRGYVADEGIYMASEGARHAFLHRQTGLNVDVFADELYFCHRIPFKDRLDLDSPTICTTDLLLEKMQIVEINLKDFKDTVVLLLEHPLSNEQPGSKSIDVDYIIGMMRQEVEDRPELRASIVLYDLLGRRKAEYHSQGDFYPSSIMRLPVISSTRMRTIISLRCGSK